jgi:hypothetical protein
VAVAVKEKRAAFAKWLQKKTNLVGRSARGKEENKGR